MASITTRVFTSPLDSRLVDRGLKVQIISATDMEKEVFVWQRASTRPDGSQGKDMFIGVATPSDLDDIPALAPDLANEMPYYRTSEVELWFRNDYDFDKYRKLVQSHIKDLVKKLNMLANLTPSEDVTYQ